MTNSVEIWVCDKVKVCGWKGLYNNLKQIPHKKFPNATQGVCPKCGCRRFRIRREGLND